MIRPRHLQEAFMSLYIRSHTKDRCVDSILNIRRIVILLPITYCVYYSQIDVLSVHLISLLINCYKEGNQCPC